MKLKIQRTTKQFIVSILLLAFSITSYSQEYKRIKVSKDIELVQLSKNVYVHISVTKLGKFGMVSSNGMLLISGNKAFLFDSPASNKQTKKLATWITRNLHSKIVGFVPNHSHDDCMGGLDYLHHIGVKSYASNRTIAIAQKENLPIPKQGFKDSLTLTLNDQLIKCYFVGEAHSKDNIVVWLPKEKILFPGCMVKELSCFKMGNIEESNLDEWPTTIDQLINKFKDAKIVIPGHGKVGGVDLLEHTKELTSKELKFHNKLRGIFKNYPTE